MGSSVRVRHHRLAVVVGERIIVTGFDERQWHPTQELRARQDGRVEMRMETTGRKELARWILSWMPDVSVLAPKSLQDRIAERLRDGLRGQE